jgi:hypothetical protein
MTSNPQGDRLTPEARRLLDAPVVERLAYLRRDHWVGYPLAKKALAAMSALFNAPPRHRMPNLLVIGAPGNGKTHILHHFVEQHPASERPEQYSSRVPVLLINCPPVADRDALFSRMLDALAAPYRERQSCQSKMRVAVQELHKVGTRLIILDELHDCLNGTKLQQRQIVSSIKDFSNAAKIPIVAAGVAAARNALAVEEQLESRFLPLELPAWNLSDGDDYRRLLASFEKLLPLPEPSYLANPTNAKVVYDFAGGTIGRVASLLFLTACKCIESSAPAMTTARIEEAATSGEFI